MSDQGEPDRAAGSGGPAGSDGHGGQDGGGTDHGGGTDRHFGYLSRLPTPVRIAVAILGPIVLTTGYFTIPFDPIGPEHEILSWAICVGLLTLLAFGMVVTTNRALSDRSDRYPHPGLGILLMSWAAILVFAASDWAMAAHHDQFVGLQTRLDALYFTGVTIATVGYGDIHPTGQVARAVVLLQLLYTFAFLVGGVAALRTRNQAMRRQRMSRGR